jgi:preprotein translocase subunit SecA
MSISIIDKLQNNLEKVFGSEDSKFIKKLEPIVKKVFALEDELKTLTDAELKEKSLKLRDEIRSAGNTAGAEGAIVDVDARVKKLEENIALAFAFCREASRRTLHMMHYKVQVIGGLLIHKGHIAEMRTGEGKTLVATLPAYANALVGCGVHVVTVNDYLSRRDAVWMGQVYNMLGITVSVINHESSFIYNEVMNAEEDRVRDEKGEYKVEYDYLKACTRIEAYTADITYGTNNEFGFDYLRDNLIYSEAELNQRMHHFAIVDEVDSILIDESRTPLIISNSSRESEQLYTTFAKLAEKMILDVDYKVDEKQRAVQVTEEGITKAERSLGVSSLYTAENVKLIHHLETAVKAKALFIIEKEYVVKDGEIIIVDEFTGRMQPGRRWSDGLHQAVEAKEGVEVNKESRTVASITFQNYFRFYKKLAGMTGTAKTSAEELYKVYGLVVTAVPTHNSIKRLDHTDNIFQTEKGKFKALAKRVKELNEKGQPVLIGTISIEKNEKISEYLTREGVNHKVLNAKNHENEGEIIADAGKKGAVTIATNMAGRGVDIKLGGIGATDAEHDDVDNLGGLFVIGTERHEARRIDNQLRGRAGRQGDSGETQFMVSLEDDLMRVFANDTIKTMMGKFGIPEEEPIQSRIVSKALEAAQEKIEGYHFDSRKNTLQYDDVLNQQRTSVYEKRKKILLNDQEFFDAFLKEIGEKTSEAAILVKDKQEKYGEDFTKMMRAVLLQIYDVVWMDHLEHMENLRESVRLRSYGQRDPLVEYKREGLTMYKNLDSRVQNDFINFMMHMDSVIMQMNVKETQESKKELINSGVAIGRNDACPCNSGKKVKKCDCKEYAYLRN